MSIIDNPQQWTSSLDESIPTPDDLREAAKEVCERALTDAKSQLHPLLRDSKLAHLEKRERFLQAFKSALEQGIARTLAVWQPGVQAIFQFDETKITNMAGWNGSIHLLVKVPQLSNAIKTLGRMLDRSLTRYLMQLGWQRLGGHGVILEVQQVTSSELRHAIGYGAMFCAVHTAPVQVWP